MSICDSIFKKGIYDLEIADIENFFSTEQEENSVLEFKSGGATLDVLYKEVSAFLNTDGGVLIIGAPREENKTLENGKKIKICTGALTSSIIPSQDTLMRSIASNIAPSPIGIRVKSFNYLQGYVYILEVPQSATPPHQVSNEGKYYIRLERDAKAAPHGIVEALFQKRQKPNLDALVEVVERFDNPNHIFVEISISNEAVISAENVGYILELRGIKEVEDFPELKKGFDFPSETLHTNSDHSTGILVKGITTKASYKVRPTMNFLFVHIGYFCKDCQLETRCSILDLNSLEFTHAYNSKAIVNSFSYEDIIKIYYNKRAEIVKSCLNSPVLSNARTFNPASDDQIKAFHFKANKSLPISYLDFLYITNGFYCQRNNKEFSFYNIEGVSRGSFSGLFDLDYIEIGNSSDWIYVINTKKDQYTFGLIHKNGKYKGQFILIGETFFQILNSLIN